LICHPIIPGFPFQIKGLVMPIYAYRCSHCGHAKDVLQKMSDPVLTECPACGASTFVKQVTAAGFQLKGSGWYVTDFKGGGSTVLPPSDGAKGDAPNDAAGKSDATSGEAAKSGADAPAASKAAGPSAAAPSPAPAPSGPAPAAGAK
jgi:putative FmdB family regulatory protein